MELAGEEFFYFAGGRHVEGIVAKRRFDPDVLDGSVRWYKIRNRNYSQWVGRENFSIGNAMASPIGKRGFYVPQLVMS